MKLLIAFLLIFLLNFFLFTEPTIKLEQTIRLSGDELLQIAIGFCVTEDGYFLVTDYKAGDVKIYNARGNYVKKFGRKGVGPNEFSTPIRSCYHDSLFMINDTGQSRIFVYNRKANNNFVRTGEITHGGGIDELYIYGNYIILSGCKVFENENYMALYSINYKEKKEFKYFLPSYKKYSLNSNDEFKKELFKKEDITVIGGDGLFDIHNDYAFFAWEGDLKIFKINLKTNEINTFGHKPSYYVKPYSNPRLAEAFFSRQGRIVVSARNKMSYVNKILTTKKHVLVFINKPTKDTNENFFMIQFYNFDGKYIKEVPLPGEQSFHSTTNTVKNKEKTHFYILANEDSDLDESHYILKYKILE